MGGKANALYGGTSGQIDVGFLEAKTIKHAMRSYTKLRVGDSVAFEDDVESTTETFEGEDERKAHSEQQIGQVKQDNTVIIDVYDDTPF
jgi:hypothetical protein